MCSECEEGYVQERANWNVRMKKLGFSGANAEKFVSWVIFGN
jgi:hypothetical protein